MAEEKGSSRLLTNSEEFRNKLLAKNSDGYTTGNEYLPGHADTISDGDDRGRDPEDDGGSVGTNEDITMRDNLLAKNSDLYTKDNPYGQGGNA